MRAGFWGKFKYQCSRCSENPGNKKTWGCEERSIMATPTFTEIVKGIEYRYWNCPIKFIPQSIWNFLPLYDYHKGFPSAPMPSFNNVSRRFLAAWRYFDSEYNKCCNILLERKD